MIVPMIEVKDTIIRVKMVNLREMRNDHSSFRNELFNVFSFNENQLA
jgi:hypothetical protein